MSKNQCEFSRPLNVARIPPQGVEEKLEAKPAERAALAERFDLIDMPALTAILTVTPGLQQSVKVTGTIAADVVHRCVVTLEPIASHLDLDVDITFMPGAENADIPGDEIDEEIETYDNGKIDLGETVAQQVGVSLDPYPRKPGAELQKAEFGAKVEKPHPFAGLTALQKMKNEDKSKG